MIDTISRSEKYQFSKELNTEYLEANYSGKISLYNKLVIVFLDTVKKEYDELSLAISLRDFTQVSMIAHKVKNNFQFVGLGKFTDWFSELEQSAKISSANTFLIFKKINAEFELACSIIENEKIRLETFLKI